MTALLDLQGAWLGVLRVGIALLVAAVVLGWSDRLVRWIVTRNDRQFSETGDTSQLTGLKRRETAISLMRTSVRYSVILIVLVVIIDTLTGSGGVTAVAGASLIVVLIGFAGQRFLTDILTGAFMVFEGWYTVGDLVIIDPWKLEGVVEEISLRATTIRAVNGERQRVHNSQVMAVRVLPRGVREFEIELFCTDEERGRETLEAVGRMMPVGPLQFVRPPRVVDVKQLDPDMIRVRASAATAAGREWLAQEFLPHVLKERAPERLIVHGPVVTEVDISATPSKYYERYYGSGRKVA